MRSLFAVLAAGLMTCGVAHANGWGDNYWGDDNNTNRQSPTRDPVDTIGASGHESGDVYVVEIIGNSPTDYARLCDGVAKVRLTADGVGMTEKYYLKGKMLRKMRDFDLSIEYYRADSPGFSFVRDSQVIDITCLRYKGAGEPDPVNNPSQRPAKLPHEVCNPESDARQCGNSCRAKPNNPRQCESSSNPWPNRNSYW